MIASQAVISGAFSLMGQAIQFGQSPRLTIIRTSTGREGPDIYSGSELDIDGGTIAIVLGFKTSDNLATAYGVAVSSTMVITTMLMFFAMRDRWHWNMPLVYLSSRASSSWTLCSLSPISSRSGMAAGCRCWWD